LLCILESSKLAIKLIQRGKVMILWRCRGEMTH